MNCIKTSQNGTQLWGFPFEKQQEQLLATDILKLCSTLPSLLSLPTFCDSYCRQNKWEKKGYSECLFISFPTEALDCSEKSFEELAIFFKR